MRIYAAISSSEGYFDVLRGVGYPHVLISFFYDQERTILDRMGYRPETMVSDSGAFSAWQAGVKVDLDDYIGWCRDWRSHKDRPPCDHVNLDVIAGSKHRKASQDELAAAVRASMANADYMRDAGLPVGEVYHQFEPLHYLDQLLERRRPGEILQVATLKSAGMTEKRAFLDGVWHHLITKARTRGRRTVGRDQLAIPPVHGLGISNKDLIWRYPWWSVDTLGWVAPGIYGRGVNREGRSAHNAKRVKSHHVSVTIRRRECARVLRTWLKWMPELDQLWERRGVTWTT